MEVVVHEDAAIIPLGSVTAFQKPSSWRVVIVNCGERRILPSCSLLLVAEQDLLEVHPSAHGIRFLERRIDRTFSSSAATDAANFPSNSVLNLACIQIFASLWFMMTSFLGVISSIWGVVSSSYHFISTSAFSVLAASCDTCICPRWVM